MSSTYSSDHTVKTTLRKHTSNHIFIACKTKQQTIKAMQFGHKPWLMKTLRRVQLQWYWPGITADVRRIVHGCEVCQVAKQGGTTPAAGRRRLMAGRPWQLVAIDLVGPMPKTKDGNQWILVVSDHFTRWCDGLAIPDATASTVARALEEKVFCYLGIPEQLHSDQGAQFDGSLMHELCDIWGVEKSRTTPYHPQANGIVERNNRTLGDGLRVKLLGGSQDEWDRVLPHIMRSMRALPHSVTKETPNLLMYGRELRLPDQLLYSMPPVGETHVHEYSKQLVSDMQDAHDCLREMQKDLRTEDSEEPLLYKIGDQVLLENRRRRKGQNPKLQTKWVGPYIVSDCFPNHTYLLDLNGVTSVQAECRLKLYRPSMDPVTQAPVLPEVHRRAERQVARKKKAKDNVTVEPFVLPALPGVGLDTLNSDTPVVKDGLVAGSSGTEVVGNPQYDVDAAENRPSHVATTGASDSKVVVGPKVEARSNRPSRQSRLPSYLRDFDCNALDYGTWEQFCY